MILDNVQLILERFRRARFGIPTMGQSSRFKDQTIFSAANDLGLITGYIMTNSLMPIIKHIIMSSFKEK